MDNAACFWEVWAKSVHPQSNCQEKVQECQATSQEQLGWIPYALALSPELFNSDDMVRYSLGAIVASIMASSKNCLATISSSHQLINDAYPSHAEASSMAEALLQCSRLHLKVHIVGLAIYF